MASDPDDSRRALAPVDARACPGCPVPSPRNRYSRRWWLGGCTLLVVAAVSTFWSRSGPPDDAPRPLAAGPPQAQTTQGMASSRTSESAVPASEAAPLAAAQPPTAPVATAGPERVSLPRQAPPGGVALPERAQPAPAIHDLGRLPELTALPQAATTPQHLIERVTSPQPPSDVPSGPALK